MDPLQRKVQILTKCTCPGYWSNDIVDIGSMLSLSSILFLLGIGSMYMSLCFLFVAFTGKRSNMFLLVLARSTCRAKTVGNDSRWTSRYTVPPVKTNMAGWKITILERRYRYIFKWLFFHCHVSFRGCNCRMVKKEVNHPGSLIRRSTIMGI